MKCRGIWPHVFFAILVVVFVLLNSFNLKQDETVQSLKIEDQAVFAKETVKVSRIVDGDTIKVLMKNNEYAVRLIGVDAPETVDPRKPIQCFGKEASDKVREVLANKAIVLESDSTQGNRDEYGRLLRYVFVDGLNFNEFMIREGYAHEYTYQNNDYKYVEEFKNAQRQAKKGKKGLWSDGACNLAN